MTLEQVLAKHAEARGGMAALDAVHSAKIRAQVTMGAAEHSMQGPLTIYYKAPDKMRVDIEVQGMTITQAWDGEIGWRVMPMMGSADPQEMSAEEAKQVKRMNFVRGVLLGHEDLGYAAEYLGVEDFEGTPAHKIKLTMEDGDTSHSYLDTEHFLEFAQEIDGLNPQTGQRMKARVIFGDFKEVGDLLMPHSIEMSMEGVPMTNQTVFEEVLVNSDEVTDDLFAMPEPAVAAAGSEG